MSASNEFELRVDSPNAKARVEKSFLRIRCFKKWRRAIKYFEFKVQVPGEYHISFRNTEGLEIKKSQLLLMRLFQKPIGRDKIDVIIEVR